MPHPLTTFCCDCKADMNANGFVVRCDPKLSPGEPCAEVLWRGKLDFIFYGPAGALAGPGYCRIVFSPDDIAVSGIGAAVAIPATRNTLFKNHRIGERRPEVRRLGNIPPVAALRLKFLRPRLGWMNTFLEERSDVFQQVVIFRVSRVIEGKHVGACGRDIDGLNTYC